MKKLLRIFLIATLCLASICLTFACNTPKSTSSSEKGLLIKKIEGEYTVYGYVDDGTLVDGVLDIGEIAEDKGIEVKRIKANSFKGNDTVKVLIIPSTVETIDEGALSQMNALTELTVPFVGKTANADAYDNQTAKAENKSVKSERTIAHLFGKDAYDYGTTQNIVFGTGESDSVTCYMPINLEKITVNPSDSYSVPKYAFSGMTRVEEVVFGDNVTCIGEHAFEFSGIEKVTVSKGVEKICNFAFNDCDLLTSIEFAPDSSLKEIGDKAFFATRATEIVLPSSVEKIGEFCFASEFEKLVASGCVSKLQKITLSASLQEIGIGAFAFCEELIEVDYSDCSEITIGNYAFFNCKNLEIENSSKFKYDEKGFVFSGIKSLIED